MPRPQIYLLIAPQIRVSGPIPPDFYHPTPAHAAGRVDLLAFSSVIAASLFLIGWVLVCCRAGLDFTDEGFYLNWISNPGQFSTSISQFGFVLHPLYRLLGGDLVFLRQTSVLLSIGLGTVAFSAILRARLGPSVGSGVIVGLGLAFATASLSLLYLWLPRPSYRSLALQALLLAALAMAYCESERSRIRVQGGVLLGVAGWLAFMAKPPTGAVLGALAAFHLLAGVHSRRAPLCAAVGTAAGLLVASAWCIDGSIAGFVARIDGALAELSLLQSKYRMNEIWRFDPLHLSLREKTTACVGIATVALVVLLGGSAARLSAIAVSGLAVAAAVACVLYTGRIVDPGVFALPCAGLQFVALPAGALLATLVRRRWTSGDARRGLILPACIAFFPFAYVSGTNGNIWEAITGGVVFWAMAAAMLVANGETSNDGWRPLLTLAALTMAGTAAVLQPAIERPYRQSQPLRLQDQVLQIPATGRVIRVSDDTFRYATTLTTAARAAGFRVGDAVIDLTGHYPTAVYLLGGRSPGLPWMMGGYPGSEDMIGAALDRVPLDILTAAWVLTEPHGPRKVSASLLLRYGLDLDQDFEVVATIDSPREDNPATYPHLLLSPRKKEGAP